MRRSRKVIGAQVDAQAAEDGRVPPPALLPAHVCIYLDDQQWLRRDEIDGLGRELPEPQRRDAARPGVPPPRRDEQSADLTPRHGREWPGLACDP
jgi:hypothetical protein